MKTIHNRTFFMSISFVLLTIILILVYDVPIKRMSYRLTFLEHNWKLVADDTVYEPVSTVGFVATNRISVREGHDLRLSHALPDPLPDKQPCLLLKTRACDLTVLADQEILFLHDHGSEGHHSRYIQETHYIDLPSSCAGKELTILMEPSADFAFGGIHTPVCGSHLDLISYSTYLNLLPIFVSLFLCMYGILFIMMSLVLSSQMPGLLSQIYAAILCLMIGIWMLGSHGVISLLLDDVHSQFLETVMQFGSIPIFYLYMRSLQLPYFRKYDRLLNVILSTLGFVIIALE